MALIKGRLCEALHEHAASRNIIRLSIDEGNRDLNKVGHYQPAGPQRDRVHLRNRLWMDQLRVIATCDRLDIPLVEVSFAQHMPTDTVKTTKDNPLHHTFVKGAANAFEDERGHLYDFLRGEECNCLVVMGYHANACVVGTVGADRFFPSSALSGKYRGAIQLGFTVMTCKQILSSGDPQEGISEDPGVRWDLDREGLEFYSEA